MMRSPPGRTGRIRKGISIAESVVTIAVFAATTTLVAQYCTESLSERRRLQVRSEAGELAVNLLELASDQPWASLTAEWGKSQRLSEAQLARLHNAELTVTVEPVPDRAKLKKVTVELKWPQVGNSGWQPVRLVSFLAAREGAQP
jgi:hypothetical protein